LVVYNFTNLFYFYRQIIIYDCKLIANINNMEQAIQNRSGKRLNRNMAAQKVLMKTKELYINLKIAKNEN